MQALTFSRLFCTGTDGVFSRECNTPDVVMGTRRLAEYWGVVGGRARHLEYPYQIQL